MNTPLGNPPRTLRWKAVWASALTAALGLSLACAGASTAQAAPISATFTSVTVTESAADNTPVTQIADGQVVHLDAKFTIPDHPPAGSTFTLGLPAELKALGGSVNIVDSNGKVIAVATSEKDGDTITFTTTDYAASLTNLSGEYTMDQRFTSNADPGTDLNLHFDGNGTDFPWDVTVVGSAPIGWDVPAKSSAPWGDDQINWAISLPGGPLSDVVMTDNLPIGVPLTGCDSVFVYSNTFDPAGHDGTPTSKTLLSRDSGRYTLTCDETTGFTLTVPQINADERITLEFWSTILDPSISSYTNNASVTVDGVTTPFSATFETAQQGGWAAGTGSIRLIKTVIGDVAGPFTASVSCVLDGAPVQGFPKLVSISPDAPVDISVAMGAVCEVTEQEDGGAVSHTIAPNAGDDQTGTVVIEEREISEVTITNDFTPVAPGETGNFSVSKQFFDAQTGNPVDPTTTVVDVNGVQHQLADGDKIFLDFAYSAEGLQQTGTLEIDPFGQVTESEQLPADTAVSVTQERFQMTGTQDEFVFPDGWFLSVDGIQTDQLTITANSTVVATLNNPTTAVVPPTPTPSDTTAPPADDPSVTPTPVAEGTSLDMTGSNALAPIGGFMLVLLLVGGALLFVSSRRQAAQS